MKHYFTYWGGSEIDVLLRNISEPKLKEATLYLLELGRYSGSDRDNLNHFLNYNNPKKKKKYQTGVALENAVRVSPTFKRIEVFLKRYQEDPKSSTDDRNIEFLAWLSGFNPRPFQVFRNSKERETSDDKDSKDKIVKESEKETHIKNHYNFNNEILNKFEYEMLIDVIREFDLMENSTFVSFRKRINDDIEMQSRIILKLENRVLQFEKKLKQLKLAKKMAGGLGLFLVSIDYREPSIANLFEDFLEELIGVEGEDIIDDLI